MFFLVVIVFFSHNKSARTVFRLVFSAKRTGSFLCSVKNVLQLSCPLWQLAKHNLVLPLDFTSTCPRIWWKAENILKTRYSKQGKASHLKTNMALQNQLGEMRKAYQLYSVSDPLPCWPDCSQTKACHERARGRLHFHLLAHRTKAMAKEGSPR